MTLNVEGVVDRGVGGEESLRGGLGFEALLLSFSSSDRKVRVLDPIVLAKPSRSVNFGQAELSKGRSVRRQTVSRDLFRLNGLVTQQATEQLQSRLRIPSSLGDEIEHFAFVIDGAPQIHPPADDPTDHFVEMPAWRRRRSALLQPPGDQRAELLRPAADGFVADVDAALGQQSSTSRKLMLKRKYSQTAWRITSAGKRWRLNDSGFLKVVSGQPFTAALSGGKLALD